MLIDPSGEPTMSAPSSFLQQRLNPLILMCLKSQRSSQQPSSSEQGLTLLECLMAIFVIGLTIALITPPLLIATATRVQNRRADQALQVAQGEVDRIRVLVARGTHTAAQLPQPVSAADNNLQNVAAPSGVIAQLKSPRTCTGTTAYDGQPIDPTKVLPVDIDGDCKADLLMQVFRTQGITTIAENTNPDATQRRPSSFSVGIRVYSILATTNPNNPTALRSGLQPDVASLRLTQGSGKQQTNPLAVIYSPFSWSEQSNTLCGYRASDSDATKRAMNCNSVFQ
jgi:type II secretory pathway pseudopilin PulG